MPLLPTEARALLTIRSQSFPPETVFVASLPTPLGRLRLAASERALLRVGLPGGDSQRDLSGWLEAHFPGAKRGRGINPLLRRATAQIEGYFTGRLRAFSFAVEANGSELELAVWRRTAAIRFGATSSVVEIARVLGEPDGERAVRAACRANPLPIVIPCHRLTDTAVHAASASARTDSATRWLLEHEQSLDRAAQRDARPEARTATRFDSLARSLRSTSL
jgi:O-6-methylguanine DNA methyltransferase